jgi:hypothetical protein
MLIKQKIKAFTIVELLVSMTLSGILVVFSFLGYNQIQKLFVNYTIQNKFITDYNQLNNALYFLSNHADKIEKTTDDCIRFNSDSVTAILQITDKNMVLKFNSHIDTFYLVAKKQDYQFLKYNDETSSTLIEKFNCQVFFQNQKFDVSFHKQYDATSILTKNLEEVPPDEFN